MDLNRLVVLFFFLEHCLPQSEMAGNIPKKRRLMDVDDSDAQTVFLEKSTAPASVNDKTKWEGFSEIESEPVSDVLSIVTIVLI